MADKQLHTGWKLQQSYLELRDLFHQQLTLKPIASPRLLLLNDAHARELGLDPEALRDEADVLAGNRMPEGAVPFAQAYAGHQFGNFTMLGDGRALMVGEQLTADGKLIDIQLKGSGPTPYSRGGDGRAALGPMLREYLISEAMHHLGIRTNRSLAVVKTGEDVYRETALPGAVLTRTASSHLRVGTFEFARRGGSYEDWEALAEYAVSRHLPEAAGSEDRYEQLLHAVVERQAELIASWQLVGFIHGVMNTDNMTISGETIDYGPCAFMNAYDPKTVFSSIDAGGRYAYQNQPYIAAWNLARLAESIMPLLADEDEPALEKAQQAIDSFRSHYEAAWQDGVRRKLGLHEAKAGDAALADELLGLMEQEKADFTNTFRTLSEGESPGDAFQGWMERWHARLADEGTSPEKAQTLMKQHNPAVIPRNHLVEEALRAAVQDDDMSSFHELLAALQDPYQAGKPARFCSPPDDEGGYRTFCGT
ncbi:protein adenylyltransferase SelO [Alkalicoccus luteus]|uniref:Protein nucleotidyltransferase YdiU n=1 Tax=Alkalicoccus luteus TaxID=1237094 RepID=A0A969PTG3_9BACI|nr:YdiU family protein [Alkalicoccus luteus]NJP38071.1 YdiU family protein [Alkalicoccus luteus]